MAILKDATSMVDAWRDGKVGLNDLTTIAPVGMDLLSAVLDPVGALIAAPLGELLDFCVHQLDFIAQPLAKLEGSDDLVKKQAEAWRKVGADFVAAGDLHAAGVKDMPSWQGAAASTYHEVMKATNEIFAAVSEAANGMANAVEVAGALVGAVRGLIWDMISQLLAKAIEAGIAALAASVPTVGASLAAFATWYTTQVGSVAIKIFRAVDQLLEKAQQFASRWKVLATAVKKARKHCQDVIFQLGQARRYAGRMPLNKTTITRNERENYVPKGSLPGDTTANAGPGRAEMPTTKGPLKGPKKPLSDIPGDLKSAGKGAATKVGTTVAGNEWDDLHRETVTRIE